jgi:hypothetical protein
VLEDSNKDQGGREAVKYVAESKQTNKQGKPQQQKQLPKKN